MRRLELLAPARDAEIGIAAIDCGADAVYIAGEAFGARQAAGNPMGEVRRLCDYAHRFGVRIFLTLNTILYDDELDRARALLLGARDAGVDALIVQDPAVLSLAREAGAELPLYASTQFAVRTPERARLAEALGFSRIILERQLSLAEIRAIRQAVGVEIECFVHGALCVAYSGQCYLSEYLTRRSANRGACAQSCRSLYDLVDAEGRRLVRKKALLSLKDLQLLGRLADLADAGVNSFKIEGRLKNVSYVRNVVRAYSDALDRLVADRPSEYCRAAYGRVSGGVEPALDKTFNRGYTQLFLDGKRGSWAAMDAPKSMGERIGTVESLPAPTHIRLRPERPELVLHNGDGFSFLAPDGTPTGFRGDICRGLDIHPDHPVPGLAPGAVLYRSLDAAFERLLERQRSVRELRAEISLHLTEAGIAASAVSEDGRRAEAFAPAAGPAEDAARMEASVRAQMGKRSGMFAFTVTELRCEGHPPFLPVSALNALRRQLAEALAAQPLQGAAPALSVAGGPLPGVTGSFSYKDNLANARARQLLGGEDAEAAYEQTHRRGVELMRSKYCIRHELGLCLREKGTTHRAPLFLVNNGRRLPLRFDCAACEMTVLDG